jgi:hypothetical protein
MDGPVVKAAIQALEAGDVEIVLPFVHRDGEGEVREAFAAVREARKAGEAAAEIADRYLFETVVRVHRAGEGAAFTGLKPAGLDHGPIIPAAERAIDTGSSDELVRLLSDDLQHEVKERLDHVLELKAKADEGLSEARAYAEAMLGLQVWAHELHGSIGAPAHAAHGEYERHAD